MNTVVEDSDMAVQTALDNISKTLEYLGNQSRRRADEGRSEVPDQDFYGEVGEAGGAVCLRQR